MPLVFQLLFPAAPFLFLASVLMWLTHLLASKYRSRIALIAPILGLCVILMINALPVRSYAKDETAVKVRILSWNAQQLQNDTAVVRQVVDRINALQADVVLLQEFGIYYKWPNVTEVAADFSRQINMPHWDFTPHKGNIFGTACFSKYPIMDVDTIFQMLSITNEAKRYELDIEGHDLALVNAHLMSYNLFAPGSNWMDLSLINVLVHRHNQAEMVIQNTFDVLMGDLNAVPGDAVYQTIGRHHSDPIAGVLTPSHHSVPLRIDHCFHSTQWVPTEWEFLGNFPSDHKALLVSLQHVE